MMNTLPAHTVGLGLRRGLLGDIQRAIDAPGAPDFYELAPENWLDVGGKFGAALELIAAKRPIVAHGLSLSLGGTDPIDRAHVDAIKHFLQRFEIPIYSEHLSASAINGHLYDLAPIAFNEDALTHITERILQVQDQLGRRISIENSSYYFALDDQISEPDFICALLERADCELLLDINNVYVNSQNHGYDAREFIRKLPSSRIRYHHVAGHDRDYSECGTIVDTHGADVSAEVFELLGYSYQVHGLRPTLLERDFNFPDFASLLAEIADIRARQGERI
jgi:uncharacterized protein